MPKLLPTHPEDPPALMFDAGEVIHMEFAESLLSKKRNIRFLPSGMLVPTGAPNRYFKPGGQEWRTAWHGGSKLVDREPRDVKRNPDEVELFWIGRKAGSKEIVHVPAGVIDDPEQPLELADPPDDMKGLSRIPGSAPTLIVTERKSPANAEIFAATEETSRPGDVGVAALAQQLPNPPSRANPSQN